jgi:hypothetical protein
VKIHAPIGLPELLIRGIVRKVVDKELSGSLVEQGTGIVFSV